MRVDNYVFVSAGDMSANITSQALPLNQIFGFAIQAVYAGSPVGSLKLQGSCDPSNNAGGAVQPTNWVDIANSTQAVSAAGIWLWNFNGAFYSWVRLVYTATSGTGTLTCTINEKGA